MSPDERGLIAAVSAAPDDDTPRLVYADWLDEHGRPERAEFVRAQVELAPLVGDSPRRRELAFRVRQLLDAHAEEWCRELKLIADPGAFRRGFAESVQIDAFHLRGKTVAALFAQTPARRVAVLGLDGDVTPLRAFPEGNAVVALDLSGNDLAADALERLADLPGLRGVRELGLLFNRLSDAAVDVLCDRPFFQNLSLLRCGANPFTDAGRDRLRGHFGDRVTFACEREPDHLYAFQNDYFTTGFGRDYTQLFMVGGWGELSLATFDHAGNVLRIGFQKVRPGEDWQTARARWLGELSYEPATIRVKRFRWHPGGGGVYDFPDHLAESFDSPGGVAAEEFNPEWVRGWLADGKFRYDYGGDYYWLNRDGVITDT